jgi:phenylpyruvate tautomerase PptA (4-oxalocrotonate tautomerase family)
MVSENLTSYEQRLQISKEVTRIHCEITGAPPTFVHTFFSEDSNAELAEGTRVLVFGSIREGRTAEQKQQLANDMQASISQILGVGLGEVTVATVDLPARWVMEGGAVLPEPGEEEAWLAEHGHGSRSETG